MHSYSGILQQENGKQARAGSAVVLELANDFPREVLEFLCRVPWLDGPDGSINHRQFKIATRVAGRQWSNCVDIMSSKT